MAIDIKQTIAETMFQLLERKPVDKITVKELVDACGISRQGFYYHFRDIMEVIEWAAAQTLQEAVEASLHVATPQEALELVFLALRRDQKLIRHLMNSQRRVEIERLLVQSARGYMGKMLRAKAVGSSISAADLDAAIRFHSYGLVGMMVEALDSGVDAGTLANQLCRVMSGEFWRSADGAPPPSAHMPPAKPREGRERQ